MNTRISIPIFPAKALLFWGSCMSMFLFQIQALYGQEDSHYLNIVIDQDSIVFKVEEFTLGELEKVAYFNFEGKLVAIGPEPDANAGNEEELYYLRKKVENSIVIQVEPDEEYPDSLNIEVFVQISADGIPSIPRIHRSSYPVIVDPVRFGDPGEVRILPAKFEGRPIHSDIYFAINLYAIKPIEIIRPPKSKKRKRRLQK